MDPVGHRKWTVLVVAFLVLTSAGCASWFTAEDEDKVSPVIPEGTYGSYGARLPAADSPGRMIRLRLARDRRAEMLTDFMDETPAVVETGTWDYRLGGTVRVALTGRQDRAYEKPVVMTFVVDGEGLTALKFDRDVWGEEGLRLLRNPSVSRPVWRLLQIRYPDSTALAPEDPSKYALVLSADGTVTVLADCNRGMGTYLMAGNALIMRKLAYTRMICPANSLFDQYTSALQEASSCMLRDGRLSIFFKADSGVLEFEPAGEE
ncbi:MAG: META domain-containing protein [Desulfobacterota bacterium]|nr:META domain-containing protein [Thermodesulfobacteriota bacterium]